MATHNTRSILISLLLHLAVALIYTPASAEEPAKPSEVQMQWDVKIPLRDGIQLSATLYLPVGQKTPSPAIFVFTPYVSQVHHSQGVYFASHGYPFLTVDVRGRGNSEGVFKASLNDAQDGHDIVEWIARQAFCNGKVAMWGGSYSGYTQWATAKELPQHLVTIVPVASPFRGVDSPLHTNVFAPYNMQWITYVSGRAAQDKIFADKSYWSRQFRRWFEAGAPFKQLDTFLGMPSPVFQEWLRHPQQDVYWDALNPTTEQYAKLSIPILTITGSYDGDQPGALAHYRGHMQNTSAEGRARHYLIIGPWDHAGTRTPKAEFAGLQVGPASLVDIPKLHLQWYAWTMREGAKPEFLQKNVAYYVMGAEKWRYADTLDAVTARSEPLYLQSTGNPADVFNSGLLAATRALKGGPDHYVYDPRDVSLAELETTLDPSSATDQRMVLAMSGKQLIYHGAAFEQDTEVSGFFKFSAWLSIDQPDTDFGVTVYQIGADGSSIALTSDLLRARYRESFREAKLIDTKEPLRYDFEHFMFVSRQINKGSRLRLVIRPLNSIYSQKNYNSGGIVSEESMKDARPVTVKLFHDRAHPSVLYVPIGQPDVVR